MALPVISFHHISCAVSFVLAQCSSCIARLFTDVSLSLLSPKLEATSSSLHIPGKRMSGALLSLCLKGLMPVVEF